MAGEVETVASLLSENAPGTQLWQLAQQYGTLEVLMPIFSSTGISGD